MADEKSKYSDLADKEKKSIVVDKDAVAQSVADNEEGASSELRAAFEDMRKSLRSGKITESGLRRVADINDIDIDEMLRFSKMSRLEMEKDPYYKSDLSNASDTTTIKVDGHIKHMFPMNNGESVEAAGVKLTRKDDDIIECESEYLGNFKYNKKDYEVRFKEINEDDGTVSYLPFLAYVGEAELGFQTENAIQDHADNVKASADKNWDKGGWNAVGSVFQYGWYGITSVAAAPGNLINGVVSGFDDNQTIGVDTCTVPKGVKVLDYTFAGRDDLQHFPSGIPDSVTSMHATFNGCSRMTVDYRLYEDQEIILPDGLTDMSLTFKNCSRLQSEFYEKTGSQIPKGVVNLTECWKGCESMSDDAVDVNSERAYRNGCFSRAAGWPGFLGTVKYDLPNFGGELTPYLSAALARDCLAGISGRTDKESIKSYVDNIEYMVDYSGQINEKFKEAAKSLDQDKLDVTQTAATMYYQGDSHLGSIMTYDELASNGARSDNKCLDENGNFYNDTTGLKNSLQEVQGSKAHLWEILAAYGGTFMAAGAATGAVTKNKYAAIAGGVAGTFALSRAFPKLYSSMYPVLNFTRNHLPDGELKDKFSDWIDEHCAAAETAILNEKLKDRNKEWDDEYNVASAFISGKSSNGDKLMYANDEERPVVSPLTDIFDRASNMAIMWEASELDTLMENSSKSCANTETFLALGTYRDPETGSFKDCTTPVVESISTATDTIEKYWKDCRDNGKYDEETICEGMREYYTTMLHAISKYDDSAVDALCEKYTLGTRDYRLAKEGLAMVNKSFMDTLTKSMEEMESEFHFMDEDMKNAVKNVGLNGVTVSDIYTVTRTVPETYTDDYVSFWEERDHETGKSDNKKSSASDKDTDNIEEQLGLPVSDGEINAETDIDVASAY